MSLRLTYLFAFIIISALLAFGVYLQIYDGFVPCPLCMLQRIAFGLLGSVFFLGIFVAKQRILRGLINLLAFLFSILGMVLAGRQIWLQHFPPQDNVECGASLLYMLQTFPWQQVLQQVFVGGSECSQQGWAFLSLNMAEWSFLWFGLFFGVSINLLRTKPQK